MKYIFARLALWFGFVCLWFTVLPAQCTDQVMHTSGSAIVAGVNVTVTTSGNTCPWTTYCPTVTQPFFIGYNPGLGSGPGSFTFTFSPAISAVRLNFSGASNTAPSIEEIRLYVNGSHYAMAAPGSNNGCDPMAILTVAGDLRGCVGCGVSGWSGTSISGSPISTLTVEDFVVGGSPNGSLFSLWICAPILPAEWLSFDANLNPAGQVALDWVTASEISVDYFAVQRSRDGENWEELDMISAVGHSDHASRYSYTDRRPMIGTAHYRLREVSDDGNSNYSEVRTVEYLPSGHLRLHPNPSHGLVQLDLPDGSGTASILVFNAIGQMVSVEMDVMEGHAMLHTSHLSPGVYVVAVQSGNTLHRARMVVE